MTMVVVVVVVDLVACFDKFARYWRRRGDRYRRAEFSIREFDSIYRRKG